MRLLKIFTIAACCIMTLAASAENINEDAARAWCDGNVLQPIEGIWEYPDDNTRVLISSDNTVAGTYSLKVLSTPDCRLNPGDVIGRLYPSIDARQYRLEQWTRKEDFKFIKPTDCTATLSSDGESIRVKAAKFKFKINPTTLLPRFWRIVRISVSNPVDDLPAGLVKIYPGYDHNGSLKRKNRIL